MGYFMMYLLSVGDGLGSAAACLGGIGAFLFTALLVGFHLTRLSHAFEKAKERYPAEDFEKRYLDVLTTLDHMINRAKTGLVVSMVVFLIGYMIPTRRGIVEGYIMVESSKVLTSENSEKMVNSLANRVDRVFSIIEGKVSADIPDKSE